MDFYITHSMNFDLFLVEDKSKSLKVPRIKNFFLLILYFVMAILYTFRHTMLHVQV